MPVTITQGFLDAPVFGLVSEVMDVFQHCDPYLNRKDQVNSPLLSPCREIWRRYGNADTEQLASYAKQLKDYFKS